ncbi:Dynein light chain [Trypanosoma melophagium]|uniref:Dynein light chain n=1 Tax=Trypanosoma melophagium TaxID=715481 RepID=UPI00351A450D|nr:Dynein light chain [Trypanosoma melophagium]
MTTSLPSTLAMQRRSTHDSPMGPLSSRSSIVIQQDSELDPRAAVISRVAVYVDVPDATLQTIMNIAVEAYSKFVLIPTRNTWRKEEGSRKELEREIERTVVRDIAQLIKKNVETALGGTWHVVYGRSFATYVTHQRRSFCHFQLDGANVVVWRHGG